MRDLYQKAMNYLQQNFKSGDTAKAQNNAPIFVINPTQQHSGLANNLGFAGMLGSGLTGVGGALSHLGSNSLLNKVQNYDPYSLGALAKVDAFTQAMANTENPGEKLLKYVTHGSDLMRSNMFKPNSNFGINQNLTGYDVMKKTYENPTIGELSKSFMKEPLSWNPQKIQHYGQFNKGPVQSYIQLAKELDEHNDFYANTLREKMTNRLREQNRTVDSSKIEERIREYAKRHGADMADPHSIRASAGLGHQLDEIAKRQFDFKLGKGGISALPEEQQLRILDHFNKNTGLGQTLSSQFAERWKAPISQYSNFANTLAAPKRLLDFTGNKLKTLSGLSRNAALASIPAFGLSLALQRMGANSDRQRQAQADAALVNAIRSAQNTKVGAAREYDTMAINLPLGGFYFKNASAYLLPPNKAKKKQKPQPEPQETGQDKVAACIESAFLEQNALMQQHLQMNDFGGGWRPY